MTRGDAVALNRVLDRFALDRTRHLVRAAIARLKRIPDPGGHPHGWDMRSLWSLYSWNVQNGPIPNADLLRDMVEDVCRQVVTALPPSEVELLALLETEYQEEPNDSPQDTMVTVLLADLSAAAASRDLDRYDPDYRRYRHA